MGKFRQVWSREYPGTRLMITLWKEVRPGSRVQLQAYDEERLVYTQFYDRYAWEGHCNGLLLMPEFIRITEEQAAVSRGADDTESISVDLPEATTKRLDQRVSSEEREEGMSASTEQALMKKLDGIIEGLRDINSTLQNMSDILFGTAINIGLVIPAAPRPDEVNAAKKQMHELMGHCSCGDCASHE